MSVHRDLCTVIAIGLWVGLIGELIIHGLDDFSAALMGVAVALSALCIVLRGR